MIKIAYDYQIFAIQRYGGISRYFFEIATRIAKFHQVNAKIIAPVYINKYLQSCPSDLLWGKHISFIPKIPRSRNWFNLAICALLFKKFSPDIVHETYYSAIKLSPKKTRTVITVYDMIHEKFNFLFRKSDKTSIIKNKAINRADHIICISENTRQDLLNLYNISHENISVVHLASSLKFDSNTTHKKSEPYIFFVGARDGYKNFQHLVKAYAYSKKIINDFNIVCFGGSHFSQKEKELFYNLGIKSEKIRQVYGDDNVLAEYYKNAAAFVFPSFYEGFGIPLLEAMSCHCPVICSNTSSFPEVADNSAEFFDPYNIDSIVHSMESVLYSTEKSQELIQRGMKRVSQFSWDICAEETLKIYSGLLHYV